ncbi:dihydroorotase [PVC group bacterium (ex Bugula neritina AB1)]|nr:dihydroorotase [PVC group bacterium (ex Bugula neritina AB1)]
MSKSLIIRQATVVSSKDSFVADVLIRNNKFEKIEPSISHTAGEEIDARGLHLIPGVLDPQVHFREPGMTWKEDLETGSKAAASGGVTSFFEMPNTSPATINAEAIKAKKDLAKEKSLVNFNFFIGATPYNIDELNSVSNVCGIKIFMGSSTGDLLVHDSSDLERIFSNGTRLIAVHAEDEERLRQNTEKYAGTKDVADHMKIRDVETAVLATRKAISLSHRFQRRLHILHMTTGDEVDILATAKHLAPITAEVCVQHFLLHAPEVYKKLGTLAQMNPPLREESHGKKLWKALQDGLIDCIATDHAPHTLEEKDQPYGKAPSGMPGVETSLPLMLNRANQGLCSLQDVVKWMCENPVKIYNVENKGYILPHYDADFVLVDMKKTKTIQNGSLHTKVNWSPYNGWETQGWPVMTFVNGNLVFREGDFFTDKKGKEVKIKNG